MTSEDFLDFSALVRAEKRTEVECTRYLHHARELLVPGSSMGSEVFLENYNTYGRSDFYIVAGLITERREIENFAFFFEAKAPQLYVMEFDKTQSRCIPSHDLIQAENQLIHYTAEAAGSREFLVQHQIPDPRNVRAGGVIIGRRSDRYLKGDDPRKSCARLASSALKLREEYFYKSSGIRVIVWDRILEYVEPKS